MVFNLSVGLQDVPLAVDERKGSGAEGMETFSMIIAGIACLRTGCVSIRGSCLVWLLAMQGAAGTVFSCFLQCPP